MYLCRMSIYIILFNGVPNGKGYTTLSGVCRANGLSCDSALRGKRKWLRGDMIAEVMEIDVIKMKAHNKKREE